MKYNNWLENLAYWSLIPGNDFDKSWTDWFFKGPVEDRRWKVWELLISIPIGRFHCIFYDHKFIYQSCDLCGKPTPKEVIKRLL